MKLTIKENEETRVILINGNPASDYVIDQIIQHLMQDMSEDDLIEALIYTLSIHEETKRKERKGVVTLENNSVHVM